MQFDYNETNKLLLIGKISDIPKFYHKAYDENFYTFNLEIPRQSGVLDIVPVMISEKLLDDFKINDIVKITGQLRTYNKTNNEKIKLLQFAFVKTIENISEEDFAAAKNHNEVVLNGFICKKPSCRSTPSKRIISDILLAVNRAYRQSDYIPVITWGRDAIFSSKLEIGTQVIITGRMQSRKYIKKIENDVSEERIAYEVSATNIKVVSKANESNESNEE